MVPTPEQTAARLRTEAADLLALAEEFWPTPPLQPTLQERLVSFMSEATDLINQVIQRMKSDEAQIQQLQADAVDPAAVQAMRDALAAPAPSAPAGPTPTPQPVVAQAAPGQFPVTNAQGQQLLGINAQGQPVYG